MAAQHLMKSWILWFSVFHHLFSLMPVYSWENNLPGKYRTQLSYWPMREHKGARAAQWMLTVLNLCIWGKCKRLISRSRVSSFLFASVTTRRLCSYVTLMKLDACVFSTDWGWVDAAFSVMATLIWDPFIYVSLTYNFGGKSGRGTRVICDL